MAAQSQEFLNYPKSRIALGAGDLVQVTNFTADTTNNAKVKHTLRKKAAGATTGTEETSLKFDMDVDENGIERDYLTMIKTGTTQKVRCALPGGETRLFTGIASKETIDQPLDDAMKVSIEMVGRFERNSAAP